MVKDKYSAVWVSHSSISDWLNCQRSYYLKNIYKDPSTGHKISIVSPPLSLGASVHEVIESLSVIPVKERFKTSLLERFNASWKKFSGKKGGFLSQIQEDEYRARGKKMLKRVEENPGPLNNLAVKIHMNLPYYFISEEENIILCGKIDWLEYFKDKNSVGIIDFKTGKTEESKDSLQLPIYLLVVSNTQKRKVERLSYWYINRAKKPVKQKLPKLNDAKKRVLKIAKEMKLARQLNRFKCEKGGCRYCKTFEEIIRGKHEKVGVDNMRRDLYIVESEDKVSSEVL